ncbi:hypothetical protein GGR34_003159 [Microvirga flocculans]|uniref:Uncharacterized protein n=1 Tax=Microvirga flocculans TaxID=217168 RepID=A0A7W6IHA8_9HYPH|nr:hypothetical protein [Microvirga flocculans]MBB4041482.1 hypothetical protein [Microvirga flocculans]
MREFPTVSQGTRSVAVLFHPSLVPVLDVFRSLSRLDDHYDLTLLDGPEKALTSYARPEAAKGIISDALLLAFALIRQRGRALSHRPIGARQGSGDEYCLLTLLGCAGNLDSDVAREAARHLEIASLDVLGTLAIELARQIDRAGLALETPSLPEFRAVMGEGEEFQVELSADRSGLSVGI